MDKELALQGLKTFELFVQQQESDFCMLKAFMLRMENIEQRINTVQTAIATLADVSSMGAPDESQDIFRRLSEAFSRHDPTLQQMKEVSRTMIAQRETAGERYEALLVYLRQVLGEEPSQIDMDSAPPA